ncbi:hypothetical protein Ahy_B01g054683 [Arachis hypogaea]|uniref:Transposase MuDR plant domain-containing protein n=1 Tax=Arachis hypogaea TaxID=3818 RepID=A0A445AU49_ARAHY|nr:hypothetical protein Ahy_B01g054683 [Arachis hypogaea]
MGEGNVAAEEGEFSVGMEFGSRESTFYAKCKGYDVGCDWLIRASLIQKKGCWEIKSYNGKHTCTMGQFHNIMPSWTQTQLQMILGNIMVNRFDRHNEMFEVRKMQDGYIYTINLAQRHCNCGHFLVKRLSYCHVLICCANQRLDWQVYVQGMYKMSKIYKVYRGEFVPMSDPSTWARYEGAKLMTNWTLRCTTKRRPKSTRYLNEMDSRDMCAPCRCIICGRVDDALSAQVQVLSEVNSG